MPVRTMDAGAVVKQARIAILSGETVAPPRAPSFANRFEAIRLDGRAVQKAEDLEPHR